MRIFLLIFGLVALFVSGAAFAIEKPRPGEDLLREVYDENQAKLANNSFGLPLFLESFSKDGRVDVDVYGVFDDSFGSVVDALTVPANWCDIAALHPNVKACTYQGQPDAWLLTFYLGRKFYQPPEDSRQVIYNYRNVVRRQGYVDILLAANAGPFGTKDHRIRFEALPLDEDRTFVHVSYGYRDSLFLRLATESYFTTLGSGKVGFTVTGTDRKGEPVYIGGSRGAVERNAVRYYFAIQAFMSSLPFPATSRFSMRINEWYDLTNRFRKQLFELDKKDYHTFKTREHENQLTLQRSLGTFQ
ncbi:MAG: hypothetical protein A2X84_04680 [Desulfuromonadaceae bacterium GWC2_58_13]|nr:MAG: hypothetical protein A2X84_04680 [Desulfuromonadaceae bacterium GWC2_58_13]